MVLIGAFWFMCRKAPLHPRAKMAVNGLFAMALAQVSHVGAFWFMCRKALYIPELRWL